MEQKKFILINLSIILVLSIIAGILLYRLNQKEAENVQEIADEKITDECVEERKALANQTQEIYTSSAEEKVSPNASLIMKKYYKKCKHTIKEHVELPIEFVNKTQEEIEELASEKMLLESFSAYEIVFLKEEEGFCNEHYLLKEGEDGNIAIYKLDENEQESLYENTSIAVEYLPQTDQIQIKNGIKAYGKEQLNSILEDYE